MATIFKRDSSPYWFACYVERSGKSVRRTTKTTDKGIALRMAQDWEHVERMAAGGQASVAAFQKVVSQVSERVIGDALPAQTVRQYFEEWLPSSARRTSPATAERYKNTVRLWACFDKTDREKGVLREVVLSSNWAGESPPREVCRRWRL